jgi:RIO kinase 1
MSTKSKHRITRIKKPTVTNNNIYSDKYEHYEELFNPLNTDRQARRRRKPKVNHKPKKSQKQIIAEVADTTGVEGGFNTTYHPARYEAGWLLASLRSFYDQNLISDVMAQVKGGKEASVYRCQAHPATGIELLAAKVYRPRRFRNLRNDQMYRQGREIMGTDGRPVRANDHRLMRAVHKRSDFGVQVRHTSWLMYEYTTLENLHNAGGAVPQPIAADDNAILMEYIGDEQTAAPALNEITLEKSEARFLFEKVLHNIELMLQHNIIHGDLSAYNILYWQGDITLIDFPQVTNSRTNPKAHFIFQRDVTRICDYFGHQGVECNSQAIVDDLWARYAE